MNIGSYVCMHVLEVRTCALSAASDLCMYRCMLYIVCTYHVAVY